MLLVTPDLCDGTDRRGAGWLRVEEGRVAETGWGPPPDDPDRRDHACLMPALVDGHCHLTGYLEYPGADQPYAPHLAYLRLLREAGVGAVRDLGNHAETPANIGRFPDAPLLRSAGPVLDEPPGRVAHSRLVTDAASVREAVRASAAEGATWVKTYSTLRPALVATAVEEAAAHGLWVAHRPGVTDAVTAAGLGVATIEHLPLCLSDVDGQRSPSDVVRSWADAPGVERLVATLSRTGVAVTPLLLAWRRASVLDEAVAEPRLSRLVDITPFHRYLLQMRGAGLAFGRRYARRYLGYEHLKGAAREEFGRGWSALLRCLVALHDAGVPLVAGSDAPGISLVPGFALHGELALWETAGLGRRTVLAAATVGNADLLGLRPWSAGVLALPPDGDGLPGLAGAELVVPPLAAERSGVTT